MLFSVIFLEFGDSFGVPKHFELEPDDLVVRDMETLRKKCSLLALKSS
jgi:hypothetical protein